MINQREIVRYSQSPFTLSPSLHAEFFHSNESVFRFYEECMGLKWNEQRSGDWNVFEFEVINRKQYMMAKLRHGI